MDNQATTIKRYEVVSRYINNQTDTEWQKLTEGIFLEKLKDIANSEDMAIMSISNKASELLELIDEM